MVSISVGSSVSYRLNGGGLRPRVTDRYSGAGRSILYVDEFRIKTSAG